jgi:formylglycine-generating enzyme required for sulfatase activity
MKEIKDLPQVDKVELPKLGGIRPGVYILTIIILIAAIIIFIIAFLPGIKNGGRFVTFNTELDNVAVYVDDTFVTGLPGQQFIKSGEHTITYKKGGIVLAEDTLSVDHPVFLTWLIRRKMVVEFNDFNISSDKVEQLRAFDLQMVLDQSRITTFTAVVNYIPYAISYAKDAINYEFDSNTIKLDLDTMSSFISSIEMVEDIQNAYDLIGLEVGNTFKLASTFFDGTTSDNVGEFATTPSDSINIETKASALTFDNVSISSVFIPSNEFVMGDKEIYSYPKVSEAGVVVNTDDFYVTTSPISQYLYSLFVNENPQWEKSNIDDLVSNGLVDRNYLKGIALSATYPNLNPITNISYNAADAFTKWLSTKTGKDVMLPSQEYWSSAAITSQEFINNDYSKSVITLNQNSNRPQLMLGGIWEFTNSPFLPYSRLLDSTTVRNNINNLDLKSDVIVKGGSILNSFTTINSVGVMERDSCFDYLGFRVIYK